jgi:hypothetical protein
MSCLGLAFSQMFLRDLSRGGQSASAHRAGIRLLARQRFRPPDCAGRVRTLDGLARRQAGVDTRERQRDVVHQRQLQPCPLPWAAVKNIPGTRVKVLLGQMIKPASSLNLHRIGCRGLTKVKSSIRRWRDAGLSLVIVRRPHRLLRRYGLVRGRPRRCCCPSRAQRCPRHPDGPAAIRLIPNATLACAPPSKILDAECVDHDPATAHWRTQSLST